MFRVKTSLKNWIFYTVKQSKRKSKSYSKLWRLTNLIFLKSHNKTRLNIHNLKHPLKFLVRNLIKCFNHFIYLPCFLKSGNFFIHIRNVAWVKFTIIHREPFITTRSHRDFQIQCEISFSSIMNGHSMTRP